MVSVSSPIPPLLLAGKLAVEPVCNNCGRALAMGPYGWEHTEPFLHQCDSEGGFPQLDVAASRHLVPVAVPPSCPVCKGRSTSAALIAKRIAKIHCLACSGSGFYTGDATITAVCGECDGLGCDPDFCHDGEVPCDDGERPVASGRIEAVLKIEDLEDGVENDHEHPHVCVSGDSVLVLKLTYGPSMDDDTDVSHLSALLDWSSFPFALLVSGLVPA